MHEFYFLPEIDNTIKTIVEENINQISAQVDSELRKLQIEEEKKAQDAFEKILPDIKNKFSAIMDDYIDYRKKNAISHLLLTGPVGTFLFPNKSKIAAERTEKNKDYITAFHSTDSSRYSLKLYENLLAHINSIVDVNSAREAITNISQLLSTVSKDTSPVLHHHAKFIIFLLRKNLDSSVCRVKNFLTPEIRNINISKKKKDFQKRINDAAKEYVNKALDKVLDANPDLKKYYVLLNKLISIETEHDNLKEKIYRLEERLDKFDYEKDAYKNFYASKKSVVKKIAFENRLKDKTELNNIKSDFKTIRNELVSQEAEIDDFFDNYQLLPEYLKLSTKNNKITPQTKISFLGGDNFIKILCNKLRKAFMPKEKLQENLFVSTMTQTNPMNLSF